MSTKHVAEYTAMLLGATGNVGRQSEQAFLALVQGTGPATPAVKILEYREMQPFFVEGDSDALYYDSERERRRR